MSDKTLVEALAKAQSEMDAPVKDKKNPQFGSLYASLGSIITAVKPALNSNGIAYVQRSLPTEDGISIETVFYGMGETLETGPVTIPAAKITPQGFGSAMTYAKRYSLAMACGVDADEDDDGEVAEVEQAKAPIRKPTAKKPTAKKESALSKAINVADFAAAKEKLLGELSLCKNAEEASDVMRKIFPKIKADYSNEDSWSDFSAAVKEKIEEITSQKKIEEENSDIPF